MTRPIILATWSFARRATEIVLPDLLCGTSSLDVVERICAIIDDDPEVDSVGYGGLPDAEGQVTLDGCIMQSPSRCGSVCALRTHRNPVTVARLVMERTAHIMLAGEAADRFADAQGIAAQSLLSEEAEARFRRWRQAPIEVDQSRDRLLTTGVRPVDRGEGRLFLTPEERPWSAHDTISVLAIDRSGVLSGACSTSGMPFKTPGRVGDSPIIGHGLYVHPRHGAAAATGRGELVMGVCGSHRAVDSMRRGASPSEALLDVLGSIASEYELSMTDQVAMIALAPDGSYATAALRPGFKAVVASESEHRILDPARVLLAT